jgi:hypothetical protein
MATPVANAMIENTSKEGTNTKILGVHTDTNPNTLAAILDGTTTTTTLNSAATPGMHFTVFPYALLLSLPPVRVYNDSGGAFSAGDALYVSDYNSSEDLYEMTKAQAKDPANTSLYAVCFADAGIGNGAEGNASFCRVLTGQDTSGLTVGRPVWLSGTAGKWSGTPHTDGKGTQITGMVITVHVSTGRVLQFPGTILPWAYAGEI